MSPIESALRGLLADFDAVCTTKGAVTVRLLHRASNADFHGVKISRDWEAMEHATTIGHRKFTLLRDDDGTLIETDVPHLNPEGKPVETPDGALPDVLMPATRSVRLAGDIKVVARLRRIAERAGSVVEKVRTPFWGRWEFFSPESVWWHFLFESAWAGELPQHPAERLLYIEPTHFTTYDLGSLKKTAEAHFKQDRKALVPANWLDRLPDAFECEIADAAAASRDAIDSVLSQIAPTHAAPLNMNPPKLLPLSDREKAVVGILTSLKRGEALGGKEILALLARRGIVMEAARLSEMKKSPAMIQRGFTNRPNVGYYLHTDTVGRNRPKSNAKRA